MKVDIQEVIKIAKLAGDEILKIYAQDFEVYAKGDASPLTDADQNANDIIIENLVKLYPDIPYISEEVKNMEFSERKNWEQCWIIDPLDGTKEFVKKNGEFTVNIALVRNGKPVLGVGENPAEKLEVRTGVEDKTDLKVVASRSHLSEDVVKYVEELKAKGKNVAFISAGSSLKFCLVAEGLADIYPRLAPTMEWDTAAAHIVCTEAGVDVVNYETNKTMKYNKENLLNSWFVVK